MIDGNGRKNLTTINSPRTQSFVQYTKVDIEKYKPKKLLWDNRQFNLAISEELNEWVEKDILITQYENGLKKFVYVVSYNRPSLNL